MSEFMPETNLPPRRRGWILAPVLSALSVIFFVISLASVIGIWVANQPVTEQVTSDLAAAHSELDAALLVLQDSKDELESLQGQIGFFQGILDSLGTDAIENTQLLSDVVNRVEGTISPLLESLSGGVNQVRETFDSIKQTIERLNELPLITIEVPGEELLDSITESLDNLEAQITDAKTKVESVTQITEDTVDTLNSGFLTWEEFVDQNLVLLDQYESKIMNYQDRLSHLEENIPTWIDAASIILTVLLLWLAISQVAVFVLSWSIYTGKDLLARWR